MLQNEYTFNSNSQIWIKSGYEALNYSDGEVVENSIEQILRTVTDLSTLSSELKSYCTDWPTTYHFSEKRANIIRPFQDCLTGADVLEIGSGCGAITRFLGETCENVIALEGSPRRAALTKLRTRDLYNVEVVCDKFEDFDTQKKFDFVTLIGVLEYASSFSSSSNPQVDMLNRVKRFLKPNGKLLIAIENQLGLKYFSGAPEDHHGKQMYGIENKYKPYETRTFGRLVLQNILKQADFNNLEFMVPYPDYKLPISIVTEEGFENCNFDPTPFALNSVDADGQPFHHNFNLKSTYQTVIENGLGIELSNSFLISATQIQQPINAEKSLAFHYSTSRRPSFCKRTHFKELTNGQIIVEKKNLEQEDKNLDGGLIKISDKTEFEYAIGREFSENIFDIMNSKLWDIDDVVEYLLKYLDILKDLKILKVDHSEYNLDKIMVEGQYFDATFDNIIVKRNGCAVLIDQEWELKDELCLGYLLFRCLLSLLNKYRIDWDNHTEKVPQSRGNFIKNIFLKIDNNFDVNILNDYMKQEIEIQAYINNRNIINFDITDLFECLPINNYSKDEMISRLQVELQKAQSELQKVDDVCTKLSSVISENVVEISTLSNKLADSQLEIANLYSSRSWLVTRPLRKIKNFWVK